MRWCTCVRSVLQAVRVGYGELSDVLECGTLGGVRGADSWFRNSHGLEGLKELGGKNFLNPLEGLMNEMRPWQLFQEDE